MKDVYKQAIYKKANYITRKDIYDKSKNKNLTFLVGFSGSGKTTLAEKMEKKYPGLIQIDLDGFEHGYDSTEGYNIVNNFIKEHGRYNKDADYEMKDIAEYLMDIAEKNPDKQYLANGIQMLGAPDEVIEEYPTHIKGTGLLKSSYRRLKRDKAANNMGAKDSIFDALRYNMKLNKDVNRIRRIIKKKNKRME